MRLWGAGRAARLNAWHAVCSGNEEEELELEIDPPAPSRGRRGQVGRSDVDEGNGAGEVAVTGRMPGTRSATVRIGHSVCRRDAATAGGREASRSHAFDSPWEGECMDARTARPIGEYSPRPFQGAQGLGGSIGWDGRKPAINGQWKSFIGCHLAAVPDVE